MSQSTDPSNFFQTSSAISESERKAALSTNTAGNPIRLPSKVLALLTDPVDADAVYVAESAGTARRLALDLGKSTHIYRGPTAPLTDLALNHTHTTLYAACWDKSIWTFDVSSRTPGRRLLGHSDFVKCVVCARLPSAPSSTPDQNDKNKSEEILISGGADAKIIVWKLTTGEKLQVLQGHERGVFTLAVDPLSDTSHLPSNPHTEAGLIVYSAGSEPDIRRWKIDSTTWSTLPFPKTSLRSKTQTGNVHEAEDSTTETLQVHETSINKIAFSPFTPTQEAISEDDQPSLYTASSDKTALVLKPSIAASSTADTSYEKDATLTHPDFVRDIAISSSYAPSDSDTELIITACRDGGVRVFDLTFSSTEPLGTYWGHFDEVTTLAVLPPKAHGEAARVASAGIDGTVRVWRLKKEDVKAAPGLEEVVASTRRSEDEDGGGVGKEGVLTEEEERELAELMEEDDE